MNTLDSRSLSPGDCFAQKFTAPGHVRYFVSAGGGIAGVPSRVAQQEGFVIEVRPKNPAGAGVQHTVAVRRRNGDLKVSPEKLTIDAGDFVLWYAQDQSVGGISIAGEGPNFSFSSARMVSDAIYTHAFGLPGRYEWIDPVAGHVAGVVNVQALEAKTVEDQNRWYEKLVQPASFEISGQNVSPKSVDIVVGQTVFWSVQKTGGVGIVDASLR
jgi:plastocyanin